MSLLDWSIVLASLLAVIGLGIYAGRGVVDLNDYFLAGRRLGVWAVALSVIATETSAATVIGGPDTSYRGDLAYLQTTIGAVASRFFLAYFFIETYYRHGVVTVYGYLEKRFGVAVQMSAALLFCAGRLFASGARLFIAAFAISTICEIDLVTVTLATGVCALVYGSFGGLRAVVWTDVLQGTLFLAVGAYTLHFLIQEVGGVAVVWGSLETSGKLRLFDLRTDLLDPDFWRTPYTFWGAVLGGFTLGVATHGTDQDMVQRMLACRTSREGKRSMVLVGLLEIPVALLFVSLGLVLWSYYQLHPGMAPAEGASVFPHFILTTLPTGLKGLLVTAILAAAMSSLDSALNALASVTITDFVLPLRTRLDEGASLHAAAIMLLSKISSVAWGGMLIGVAVVLGRYHQWLLASVGDNDPGRQTELLSLALGVMSLLYGPLLGIFLIALFTERGTSRSCVAAMLGGLGVAIAFRSLWGDVVGWTWHIVIGVGATMLVAALEKPCKSVHGK
ncbi:MAG: sodium/solute symporter [Bdellovibrionales bacterium]|nr:sodium/solute symporter [Bdellovibrionales bacterium]